MKVCDGETLRAPLSCTRTPYKGERVPRKKTSNANPNVRPGNVSVKIIEVCKRNISAQVWKMIGQHLLKEKKSLFAFHWLNVQYQK